MTNDQPNAATGAQPLLDQFEQLAQSHGDLARLLGPLRTLLDRLAALERDFAGQLQRDKLSAMQALAYGASHEINNPLANIAARAQTLLADEKDPQRRRSLATINAQAFRAHEMIADLMLFAKPPAPQKKRVDLAELARRVAGELAEEAAEQGTMLTCAEAEQTPILVNADEEQIAVALRALCQNALEAVRRGGEVALSVKRRAAQIELSVSDTGPGLSDDVRRHLFDPFYCGREAGRGLGLGLSKAWRIMELHGGKVLVSDPAAPQTTFTLVFPMPLDAA